MWLSIRRVLIATTTLILVGGLVFAASKKVSDAKQKNLDSQSSTATTYPQASTGKSNSIKQPVQTPTEITTTTPVEVTPNSAKLDAPAAASGSAVSYSIDWYVIAAGGGSGTSTNYKMDGTVGQTAVGPGTSTNYKLNSGFWQNFPPPTCCISPRGDANNDGANCNILDLTFLVDRIFRGGPPAVCLPEADMNGDGNSSNILDLTFTVDRIFRGGPAPGPCL